MSKEHRYRFANQTYADILGLPDANIVGRRVSDALPELHPSQIRPRLQSAFAGQRVSYELHLPLHPQSGDERFYEVFYEPRTTRSEEPYVVVVILRRMGITRVRQCLDSFDGQERHECGSQSDEPDWRGAGSAQYAGSMKQVVRVLPGTFRHTGATIIRNRHKCKREDGESAKDADSQSQSRKEIGEGRVLLEAKEKPRRAGKYRRGETT